MQRCGWVSQDQLYIDYHDKEWGVPETDGKKLFEMICLEGQQAGLSWITVLKKRENYRRAFHHYGPGISARHIEIGGIGAGVDPDAILRPAKTGGSVRVIAFHRNNMIIDIKVVVIDKPAANLA